ncbi:tail assembly protein [Acinetobacter johnsonii]|uniref:tail assembly protein n=1 Tax=Acinetobacter johnsonii TaxID=40214 RepID=UPI002447CA53|nr:tail assembly protein [Acinetobacter johnsonii]MDH1712804.1 tail assembly protein [Acinetobacter johnsonii]
MLKTIKLYGILAKKFGKQFKLDVANTREAIRALSAQIPGFEKFMLHAHEHGLGFAVYQDKHNISEYEIDMSTDAAVIKIVPKVIGAGGDNGLIQVVLGVVLVVAGYFTFGATSPYGMALIGAGVGMAIGGITQMLMPTVDTTQDNNQDGNRANKGFGGAVTTVAQGNPVPVLRGRREIGGFINSAGQYPEDLM